MRAEPHPELHPELHESFPDTSTFSTLSSEDEDDRSGCRHGLAWAGCYLPSCSLTHDGGSSPRPLTKVKASNEGRRLSMRSVRRRSLSEPRKGTKQIPVEHAGGPPVLLLRTAAVDAAGCGVAVFYVSTVLPRFARDGAHHRISPHCALTRRLTHTSKFFSGI
jgi:hypothetical protein